MSAKAKSLFTLAILLFVFSAASIAAKKVYLKSGTLDIKEQSPEQIELFSQKNSGKYILVSFSKVPSRDDWTSLSAGGLQLIDYLPDHTYYALLEKNLNKTFVSNNHIYSMMEIPVASKIHPLLIGGAPAWAQEGNEVSLIVSYFGDHSALELNTRWANLGVSVTNNHIDQQRVFLSMSEAYIKELIKDNLVFFVEPVDPPGNPENYGARTQHRSNTMAEEYAGGNKYDGTGVSVGMHDDGFIGPHIDYEGRLPAHPLYPTYNSGDHGDHVAGTIMGAGNLDPKGRGMAFGSDLYVYGASNNNYDSAVAHYNRYDVVITSKSYSNGCNAGYTSLTRQLDAQVRQNPGLIHVFSAGNNGTSNCGYGAGSGWGNITGGHKMGKNVIATGNLNSTDGLAGSSSRGPASDGRIKPDICAKGTSVYSTVDENDYDFKTGTSMACPGISGSLAQLYHAYKDMHSGQNPPSGLIKGLVLNTADDLGNPGPDFKHGWGRINLNRAYEVLSNNQFISASISSSANNNHSISVPAGTQEVRIMLYWHDYEATTTASKALVNNLDLTVGDTSGTIYRPWVLNPAPNATTLDSPAVRAIDTLNNMEQVTITNPAPGSYTVNVAGTLVPQGPQDYFIIYEFRFNEIELTYPNGGEGLVPGETETIRWDAYGNTSSFDLEYSTDGGSSWNTISTGVSASLRQFNWNVPNNVNAESRVRVSRGLISDQSDADFSIVGVPSGLTIDWACTDSMKLSWNQVNQAHSYRVYMLGNKYMDSVGTANTNSFVFHNTNPLNEYWVSVSANADSLSTGRRARAIKTNPGVFNCPLINDAAVGSILKPVPGTYLSCVGGDFNADFYIRNDGINIIQNIQYEIRDNSGVLASGTYADSIMPGDSVLIQESNVLTLTQPQFETMEFKVTLAGDSNQYNDMAERTIEYRNSTTVNAPWDEDFDTFNPCGTQNDCGNTVCALQDGFYNDESYTIDDHDWRTDVDGTISQQTGPDADHTTGQPYGRYLYLEASSGCEDQTAHMMTPCLDLTNMSEPAFYYHYHMYGAEMGTLHLDVLHENGYDLDVKTPISGNRGPIWYSDTIRLDQYVGQVISIRFRGVTGNGYRSDMALDDFGLIEKDPFAGIAETALRLDFRIYPNPSNDLFNIEFARDIRSNVNLEIRDLSGRIIQNDVVPAGSKFFKIDASNLPEGVYFLRLGNDPDSETRKLIKL